MMRSRSRGSFSYTTPSSSRISSTNSEVTHSCPVTTVSVSGDYPYPVGKVESMSDVVIPRFQEQSAKGAVFINPMSYNSVERSFSLSASGLTYPYGPTNPLPGAHRHCAHQYKETVGQAVVTYNSCVQPVMHLGADISTLRCRELAGTEAAAGIDNSGFQGATFIAELRETIGYVRKPLGRFVDHLSTLKKVKNRSRSKAERFSIFGEWLGNNWLRYRYGFRPLHTDIEKAAEAVAAVVLDHRPVRETSRGSAYDSYSFGSEGPAPGDGRCTMVTNTDRSVSVRCGVLYEYQRSPDTFGIGFTKVIPATWEAIPYSFVVDRFFNVGSFIEAITPIGGIKRLGSWTSVVVESTTTRETRLTSLALGSYGSVGVIDADGLFSEQLKTVSKTRSPGLVIGLSSQISPLFDKRENKLETAWIADMMALGRQILSSR